ncbi:GIY-YIG nuclease family protein [Synechococcus sp. UW179A]|uniref:GIY-YIG nuclease family protein n=1 Tax=Synechococcus sp. UW179A TaxID=2575510 RepID=UPI001482E2F5|nr:GIY-YIG nuclease family protein [Synechococcus sp. UW179A]
MPASPRQGSLFEQPAPAGRDNEPAELALNVQQLQSWQQRIHSFQSPLFQADGASQEQASLFSNHEDPAAEIQPLSLKPLPLSFWRWPQSPHQGAALYWVMDRPSGLQHPILLYIGETMAADRRWKGEHDCKAYLSAYQEACVDCGLTCRTSIRFWGDVPKATRARRQLEQTLIRRWQPPFNKESRDRWATPFQAA